VNPVAAAPPHPTELSFQPQNRATGGRQAPVHFLTRRGPGGVAILIMIRRRGGRDRPKSARSRAAFPLLVSRGMNPRFVELAADPALIPGVYNYCDQWCTYCPVTARCLAFRCLKDRENRSAGDIFTDMAASLNEAIAFTRDVVAAEGGSPPELAALAALPPLETPAMPTIDDPLERLGRQYAMETSRFLMATPSTAFHTAGNVASRPGGPTPIEVVMWYHVLIAVKIFRALVSDEHAKQGQPDRAEDAAGTAKVALLAIERSRKALRQISSGSHDPRALRLITLLDRLGSDVEARFPNARAFVRPGLDSAAD
jgi:hypothetical protein